MSRLNNRKIWAALSRTDPRHTKPFKRAGGFGGKSVKPIYTDLKMTEMFGACGIGWGYSMPNFQLVNGPDGSVLVYCTLALWYVDPESGKRSDPIPGVGGDFAVVKQQSGLRADDEAFKKATTDAIGNAMKHIGMSADIHMGQHDDDKYVTALKAEFVEEELQTETDDLIAEIEDVPNLIALSGWWKERQQQINSLPADLKSKIADAKEKRKADLQPPASQVDEPLSAKQVEPTKASAQPSPADRKAKETAASTFKSAIEMAEDLDELGAWWKKHWPQIDALPDDLKAEIVKAKDACKTHLSKPALQAAE